MKVSVAELRKHGLKVSVYHSRNKFYPSDHRYEEVIDPRGGSTEVVVTLPSGKVYRGFSYCSNKDNFNKKLGVKIALGRAMKQVGKCWS